MSTFKDANGQNGMKRIFCIFFSAFPLTFFAQSGIDSLKRGLKTSEGDTATLKIYDAIGFGYMRINLDSALVYFSRAEQLATKAGMPLDAAKSRYRKGTAYRSMNLYARAEAEIRSALPIFLDADYTLGMAIAKIELATIASKLQNTEEAVRLYLEAIPLSRKAGNVMAESRIYNYLGNIYKNQKQYEKALENYKNSLGIVREMNFKLGIAACLSNLGNTYSAMGRYDEAIPYMEEALKMEEEIGDKLGACKVMNNLGEIYQNNKEPALAKAYFKRSLALAREVGDLAEISRAQFSLAENAFNRGDFKVCIQVAEAILVPITVTKDRELSANTHELLSRAHEKAGDYRTSLLHARKYEQLSDSLYNAQILGITNELEARFQNHEKTREIALLSAEKELQALQLDKKITERNALISLALIMLLMAGLLYNQFRVKQRTNRELRETDRLKSNFFANISHEFRTPLTLIKGPIEQLEQNPDRKIAPETLTMIRRNTDRVLMLVNQLLDLSKIDEGNLKLEPADGDVFQCLRAVASSFSSHAEQRGMDYRVEIPESRLPASFDRDKLEKVVYNLLGNAFKFSPDHASVSLHAQFNGQILQIQVGDTGEGIPEDKIPYIFDRFYQADDALGKTQEGTGIGLSLCRELVALMEGTLGVESQLNRGSVFTLKLPLKKIPLVAAEFSRTVAPQSNPIPNPHPFPRPDQRELPRVLLVEDNADMRRFIRDQLLSSYRIEEAVDGRSGIKKAIARPPDLIITDLMMPGVDGLAFCEELKTNLHTSHIPVIMLTARAATEDKLNGLETGADDYLTKPFDARELMVRARNLISQRQKLRTLFSNRKAGIDPKQMTVTSLDQKFLESLLALLETHYSDPAFGLPQMQERLGMSKTQLHRKLKALTNEAPGELLRNFRLKKAAQLLSQKADTITQIAYRVGFNDLSYFTRCFKELYGVVPSAF